LRLLLFLTATSIGDCSFGSLVSTAPITNRHLTPSVLRSSSLSPALPNLRLHSKLDAAHSAFRTTVVLASTEVQSRVTDPYRTPLSREVFLPLPALLAAWFTYADCSGRAQQKSALQWQHGCRQLPKPSAESSKRWVQFT